MTDRKVEIYTREGKIVVEVEGWDETMALAPADALRLMECLHDAAVHLGATKATAGTIKSVWITDSLRQAMVNRAVHIMRSLNGRPQAYIAVQVVDSLLEQMR